MNLPRWLLPGLVLLGLSGAAGWWSQGTEDAAPLSGERAVTVAGEKFLLEVADTTGQRQRGLMERLELCANCGMLFDFGVTGRYGMWMERTLIPLDMWWLEESGRVVWIEQDLPPDPCGLESCAEPPAEVLPEVDARYVIEVLAGTTARVGLRVGDRVGW